MPTSMFGQVQPYAGDPIFKLVDQFHADPHPDKINLCIGVFTGEDGKIPVLDSVRTAHERVGFGQRPYLPMEGDARFRDATQRLAFGEDHPALGDKRIATMQSLGGSGALGIAADFLAKHAPGRTVYVSDPTWENHHGLFQRAGFTTTSYRYWNATERALDVAGMLEDLRAAPEGSIVIIQPVCHNPTGLDLDEASQKAVSEVVRERRHIVMFDMAYQGFGTGVDADAAFVRRHSALYPGCLVATSFSKNFSLYGERCGALHVVCETASEASNVLGQLRLAIRRSYSSPSFTAGSLVGSVLDDAALNHQWRGEVDAMRARLEDMRAGLVERIEAQAGNVDVSFLSRQRGMFAYTGIRVEDIRAVREDGLYLLDSGRISVAGLTTRNLDRVATALAHCFRSSPS
ncbi:aminotransferase class I/II-fold pyridoxal phosphate-dependent enzyme [Mesorhizobium sp. NBSH29]|nr:aminotransferase class I/II-fold pyridoxal phosphate-dependent enzyme [Mesorhizobium sp. NBSH29]